MGARSPGQPRRHRLSEACPSAEPVLCELKAALTVCVPFILGSPPTANPALYSFNKCVLGLEEARVRESTSPSPQGAHGLRENQDYTCPFLDWVVCFFVIEKTNTVC